MQEGSDYLNTLNRPREGDLIYFPMVGKIFEVMFVDHKPTFYPMGRLQVYDLRCELFEYSSERINTGNTEIDLIEDTYTQDVLSNQFTIEDDTGVYLSEDGGTFLQEFRIENTNPTANNEYLQFQGEGIIDFSEINPFSEVDRY
jgi:hypothetical protein